MHLGKRPQGSHDLRSVDLLLIIDSQLNRGINQLTIQMKLTIDPICIRMLLLLDPRLPQDTPYGFMLVLVHMWHPSWMSIFLSHMTFGQCIGCRRVVVSPASSA